MLLDETIRIIADYLGVDREEITENTNILYEYDLEVEQLEELSDILAEETGRYFSPDIFDEYGSIGEVVKEIQDY